MAKIHATDLLLNLRPNGIPKPHWDWIRTRTSDELRFAKKTAVVFLLFTAVQLVVLIVAIYLLTQSMKSNSMISNPNWIFIAAAPFWLGITIAQYIAMKRLKAALKRATLSEDALLCGECGYLLKGLATEGRCPECGTHYTSAGIRQSWADALKKM